MLEAVATLADAVVVVVVAVASFVVEDVVAEGVAVASFVEEVVVVAG